MIQGVRNIIFDLGGVLLNIDYNLTVQAFQELGIQNFDALYSQMQQVEIFDLLETGKIGEDEFVQKIQELSPVPLTHTQIVQAWNALLLDFPLRRLQILQQLQLHYNIFLLSNTNEIHERCFNKQLSSLNGIPTLAVFFDKVYYSHKVGLRKPMKEIFELVLNENGLKAEETLFIDDSPQHIATASGLGIQTIFMEKGMTIENDIFKPKG